MPLPSPNLDDRKFQEIVDDVKRQIGLRSEDGASKGGRAGIPGQSFAAADEPRAERDVTADRFIGIPTVATPETPDAFAGMYQFWVRTR